MSVLRNVPMWPSLVSAVGSVRQWSVLQTESKIGQRVGRSCYRFLQLAQLVLYPLRLVC